MNAVELYINSIKKEQFEKEQVAYKISQGDFKGITHIRLLQYIQESIERTVEPYINQPMDEFNEAAIRAVINERLRDIQMSTGIDYNYRLDFHRSGQIELSLDTRQTNSIEWLSQKIYTGLRIPREYIQ